MPRLKKTWLTRFRIVVLLSALFLILFLIGIIRETVNRYQIKSEIKALEIQAEQLEDDNTELVNYIAAWMSGHQLEKEARLKLGLQKPGENVVLIQRGEVNTSTLLIGQNPKIVGNIVIKSEPDQSNWSNPSKWWYYFFQK